MEVLQVEYSWLNAFYGTDCVPYLLGLSIALYNIELCFDSFLLQCHMCKMSDFIFEGLYNMDPIQGIFFSADIKSY